MRPKLLKIWAQIRISMRRVWISFSKSYPGAELFKAVRDHAAGVAARRRHRKPWLASDAG
jgi:hypothetical protein